MARSGRVSGSFLSVESEKECRRKVEGGDGKSGRRERGGKRDEENEKGEERREKSGEGLFCETVRGKMAGKTGPCCMGRGWRGGCEKREEGEVTGRGEEVCLKWVTFETRDECVMIFFR